MHVVLITGERHREAAVAEEERGGCLVRTPLHAQDGPAAPAFLLDDRIGALRRSGSVGHPFLAAGAAPPAQEGQSTDLPCATPDPA